MPSAVSRIKVFVFDHPYVSLFLSILVLFSVMAFQGLAFTYSCDYFVYVSVSQNLKHWGTLYKDAIDTKNTSFLFTFFAFLYYPYSLLFATTEYLHIANAIFITFWYTILSFLIYGILKPLYGKGPALFAAFAFQLFLLGNRHSLFLNQPQVAIMAVLLLVLLITRTYHRQSLPDYFIYGIFLGLCFLYSSPYIFLIFSIPVMAWRRMAEDPTHKKRRFVLRGAIAGLGFLVALSPFLMYFLSRGGLGDWWFWNFTYTNSYFNHSEFYVMSGLQVLPLLVFAPYWAAKRSKNLFKWSLLAYLSCFAVFALTVILIFVLGRNNDLLNGGWQISFLQKLQNSDNLFIRLSTVMYDIPWKNWFTRPLISLATFFTGNSILIVHTPQIIYHYFVINTALIGSAIAMIRFKKYPPLPLFLIGILALWGRLNLARGAGSDSYNIYLVPLVILWIPYLLEVFKETAFPKIQEHVFVIAYAVALIITPFWGKLASERLTDYSAQIKAIVAANPEKTPTLVTYPWVFSYSTRWVHRYYNQYLYRSTRPVSKNDSPSLASNQSQELDRDFLSEERIKQENPEVVIVWNPLHWREYNPSFLKPLTNYRQVTDDSHWLFIRKDALSNWTLPPQEGKAP